MLEGVESKAYYEQRQEFNVCVTHRLGTERWRFGVSQAGFARSHEKGRWQRVNRLASKMWPLLVFWVLFCFCCCCFVCLFLTRVQGLRRAVNWMVLGLRVQDDVPRQPQ